jgi:hypothetical protein
MGYAGYAPGHRVAEAATPVQAALAQVKSEASLELIGKLTRNSAQSPAEEKYRKVRLTNEKISPLLVEVKGAKEAMMAMGWVEEGEFLVLPKGTNVTMTEVRNVEDAKTKLKKAEQDALFRGVAKKVDPEMQRLREQMEADKRERLANGPITKSSVAVPKGNGGLGRVEPASGG